MADVPDINPLRPLWPTRPEERGPGKRRPTDEQGKEKGPRDEKKDEPPHGEGSKDGHIDEYV